jgi:hypothetical protein
VVVLCTDPTIIDTLSPPSPDEVALIFSHPLEAILDPSLALREPLSEKGGVNWPYQEELYVRHLSHAEGVTDNYRILRTAHGRKQGVTYIACIGFELLLALSRASPPTFWFVKCWFNDPQTYPV